MDNENWAPQSLGPGQAYRFNQWQSSNKHWLSSSWLLLEFWQSSDKTPEEQRRNVGHLHRQPTNKQWAHGKEFWLYIADLFYFVIGSLNGDWPGVHMENDYTGKNICRSTKERLSIKKKSKSNENNECTFFGTGSAGDLGPTKTEAFACDKTFL